MSKTKEFIEKASIDHLFVQADVLEQDSEHLAVEPYSYWSSVFREFKKKPSAIISLIVLVLIILLAIFVPLFPRYNITLVNIKDRNLTPNGAYWFGTNSAGVDIWTQVWTGARTSLSIALVVSVINTFLGIIIGTIWGYFKKLDLFMLEFYNFITNIPSMLYYMILVFVLTGIKGANGQALISPVTSLVIAMTLTGWLDLARFIRNQILIFSNREYNVASRTLGTPARRIIVYNLLPYILTVIITQVSLQIPAVIGTEVSLSYFGLGLPMDAVSLGRILNNAYQSWTQYPHVLLFPALVVGFITIVFYLIGLALSDALDPKTHR